jgi:hypothetical protein
VRIGLDRDRDGYFDRDEKDVNSNPADPNSVPATLATAFAGWRTQPLCGDEDATIIDLLRFMDGTCFSVPAPPRPNLP